MARTILHSNLKECWIQRRIPNIWKKSITILIHKKVQQKNQAISDQYPYNQPGLKYYQQL